VRRDLQRASDYVPAVVRGISTRLGADRLRTVAVSLGCALYVGTVVWIATFPVSVGV